MRIRSQASMGLLIGALACGGQHGTAPPPTDLGRDNPPYFVSTPPQDPVPLGSTWEYLPVVKVWGGGREELWFWHIGAQPYVPGVSVDRTTGRMTFVTTEATQLGSIDLGYIAVLNGNASGAATQHVVVRVVSVKVAASRGPWKD